MAYISVAIEVDPTAIRDEQISYLQSQIPGLDVRAGHVLYWLIEADAAMHAENRQLLTEQTELLFQVIGERLFRIAVRQPTQATGASTWTRVDTAQFPLASPVTIPAGTEITLPRADGEREAFLNRNEVTFAANVATTGVGEVELIAVNPGAQANLLQAGAQPEEIFDWLDTITLVAPTAGGAEGETEAEYRDRASDRMQIMGDTLVIPADYEIEARTASPQVERALAIDLYNASTSTPGVAGHITVAVINDQGLDPGSTARTEGQARQQDLSVSGLIVHWIAATYNTIDVTFTAVCFDTFDPATVEAAAEAAVADLLSPARAGLPPFGDQALWLPMTTLRYRDVVAAIENVPGLDYTTAVTVEGGTVNVALTGPAALPQAGVISGTVVAP